MLYNRIAIVILFKFLSDKISIWSCSMSSYGGVSPSLSHIELDKTTMEPFIRYLAQQSYEVILEIEYFASIHSFMPSNVNKGCNWCKGLCCRIKMGGISSERLSLLTSALCVMCLLLAPYLQDCCGFNIWSFSRFSHGALINIATVSNYIHRVDIN